MEKKKKPRENDGEGGSGAASLRRTAGDGAMAGGGVADDVHEG